MNGNGKHIAVYARISKDKSGRREGVEAQERWGREYASEHWPELPIELFADNDITAARDDVVRPEFERFRQWVRDGKIAHVWVSWQSRLSRNDLVSAILWKELRDAGISEIHSKHEGVRGVGDIGTKILGTVDAHYAQELRDKVIDSVQERARQGRRTGGAPSFGYRAVELDVHLRRRSWYLRRREAIEAGADAKQWTKEHPRPDGVAITDERGRKIQVIVEDEAEALRTVATMYLAGHSKQSCADYLNEHGFISGHGGRFTRTNIRQLLLSPGLAGLRKHQGEVIGKAMWEPVLDESTWRQLKAKFEAQGGWKNTRRYLLAGRAYCGVCGNKAYAAAGNVSGRYAAYQCHARNGVQHGHVSIIADHLETWVTERLFAELDNPEFLAGLEDSDVTARRDEVAADLADIEEERKAVARRQADGRLTLDQFDLMNDALIERERTLSAELVDLPTPEARVDASNIRRAWPNLDIEERREVIATFIDRVIVNRAYIGSSRPRQADVAAHAGVSRASVGHVLHDRPGPSAETVAKVRRAIDELGYRLPTGPNGGGSGGHFAPIDDRRVQIEWRRAAE